MPDQNGSKNSSAPHPNIPASNTAGTAKPASVAQPATNQHTNAPATKPPTSTGASVPSQAAKAPAPTAPTSASATVKPVPASTTSTTSGKPATIPPPVPANSPGAPQSPVAATGSSVQAGTVNGEPDYGTREDLAVHSGTGNGKEIAFAKSNPLATVGDGGRLMLYLLPMLLVVVGSLHLLRRFYSRTGRLPNSLEAMARLHRKSGTGMDAVASSRKSGVISAMVSFFRRQSGSKGSPNAIRLVESMPMGFAQVHLIEVRGRVLLLGATASSLNLLTEIEPESRGGTDDFRDLLHAAASDMDALDYSEPDLPASATVSALEDLIRETDLAVSKRSRRLRTVRETVQDEEDEHA